MTREVIYKVLWVDDLNRDKNNKLTDFYEGWQLKAEKYNIELVPFDNWEEAEKSLRKDFDEYSAIILDANCKIHKEDTEQEEFITAVLPSLTNIFGEKRSLLPWYILSAGTMTNFGKIVNGARYQHSKHEEDWGEMLYLKDVREGGNAPEKLFENIVRVAKDMAMNVVLFRHHDTFCYLGQDKLIDARARKYMLRMLSALHYPEENIKYEYEANPLRKILEYLFRSARKQGLLSPYCFDKEDHVNLTYSSLYLKGATINLKDKENGMEGAIRWGNKKDCVFPDNVANIVRGILVYANVDSHTYEIEDAPYLVDENSKDLFFGYVLQLCYVIKWYGEFVEEHPDVKENQRKQSVRNIKGTRMKVEMGDIIDNKYLIMRDGSTYYCGRYKLDSSITIKSGQVVIEEAIANDGEDKAKYPYIATKVRQL
ncbi:MAG: hypothetical protein E7069_02415 [Bacteroidales bacterium]|jgi:hypothetical protein|nr:hypothetical protein [Bacteroidales bacterium]